MEAFEGRVIPESAEQDEFEITILLTRQQGGTWSVMTGHEGVFIFGRGSQPTIQLVRSVKQLLYGGVGVPADNWLERSIVAHDVP